MSRTMVETAPSPMRSADRAGRFGLFEFGLYAITVFAWSTSWIALKVQLGVVAPEVSLVWRFSLSALFMWVWVIVARLPWRFPPMVHLRFVALGALIFSTNFALFYYGGQELASGLLSVVFSLASIFNLILGALLFRTRIEGRVLVGGVLGFAGVALMFWPIIHGADFNGRAALGLGYCVAGTLSFCLGNMVSGANQRVGIPVLSANAWGMVYGTILLAITAAAKGETFMIEPTARYLGSLAWLSFVSSGLAFWAYLTLLGRIGASRAGYTTVMFPVFALMISTAFEGYQWSLAAILGLGFVLAGNLFVLRRGA
ncbi:DMT family transporter [Methyloraptor flagellatus]|uniref:DMT family transporter n=1 Tax=Methyloraptor flagellatus TaxID=3162530 RepID=A0AAU7X5V8_9HYPH